jgi:hypothetical protein
MMREAAAALNLDPDPRLASRLPSSSEARGWKIVDGRKLFIEIYTRISKLVNRLVC